MSVKKIYFIFICAVLTVFTLTGCKNSDPSKENAANENTKNTADGALKEDDVIRIDYEESEIKASENTDTTRDNTADDLVTEEQEIENEPMLSADMSFYYTEVPEEIRSRMRGLSYPADDSDAMISWDELRYLKVLYVNYNGITMEGELVCNKAIADDLIDIFRELYNAGYQICQIRLVDDFNADDDLSIAADNTSCFNYRVVEGTTRLSNHGLGRAIDLNPLYNPCVYLKTGRVSPPAGEAYADRSADFPHKIDENDLAYKLFISHGFSWGGSWNTLKDYQHFEKK